MLIMTMAVIMFLSKDNAIYNGIGMVRNKTLTMGTSVECMNLEMENDIYFLIYRSLTVIVSH